MLFPKEANHLCARGSSGRSVLSANGQAVKLTVVSKTGKEATIGILSDRSFYRRRFAGWPTSSYGFGNGNDRLCCAANRKESDGGCASSGTRVFRPIRSVFARAQCPLRRRILVDQLFNSSEKRLARVLLMLAHFGKDGVPETVIPKISQESLAGNGRHDPLASEFFHEQIQEIGIYSLQRRVGSPQLASQCCSARLASAPQPSRRRPIQRKSLSI